MARYGDGTQYGDESQYGDIPAPSTGSGDGSVNGEAAWIVNVKWDGVQAVNEGASLVDFSCFRGSEYYIPVNGSGFEEMKPGKATLTFLDTDRRYDEYNTASPIYPNAVPGRPVEVLVHIFATGLTETVFTGFITDIDPVTNENIVKVTVEDEMRGLQDVKYKAGVLYNPTVSDAIYAVLNNVGFTKPKMITYSRQPVYVFDPRAESALDIIHELASANLGVFYVNRRGLAIFHPINIQSTVLHTLDQSQLRKELSFPKSWESVRNHIRIRVNRRGKRPGSVIWTMPGVHNFSTSTPNEIFDITATWEKSSTAAQPTPYADFYANTQADGNGTDVTEEYTVTLSEIQSTSCQVRVTRTSGTPGYLLSLRIEGNEIVNAPHDIIGNADVATINFYRPRDFEMDNPYMQDSSYCRFYAGLLKVFLSVTHPNATIQIEQRPEIQYDKDLMERVYLTAAARNFAHVNAIRGIRHEWLDDTGNKVITTLYLQDTIYDTTEIEADPWTPGAIETPVIPYPETPPITIPVAPIDIPFLPPGTPLDPTNFCLMTDAPSNGAYYATPTVKRLINDGSGSLESFLWYPCTLRAGSCLNKSTLVLWGGWAYWDALGVQTYDIGNTWWHVDAIAADGSVLCSGVILENGRTSPRTVTFSPGQAVEVAGFRIWIDAQAAYTAGIQIGSGSIDVMSDAGATISGLTVGTYYAVENAGGPWYPRGSDHSYATIYYLQASNDGGANYSGRIGGYGTGAVPTISPYATKPTWALAAELIQNTGNKYSRFYFKAAGTSIKVNVPDSPYDDNGGSLGYVLKSARLAGTKCLVIDNCGIKNVCGSGIL